jgi:hypothetical protein
VSPTWGSTAAHLEEQFMTHVDSTHPSPEPRLVTSADGTSIAYEAATIDVPVLALSSSGTMMPFLPAAARAVAAALSRGEYAELEGGLHEVPAATLAPVLVDFTTTDLVAHGPVRPPATLPDHLAAQGNSAAYGDLAE